MDKQRLLELAGITEAKYDEEFLGTLSNSFYVRHREDAERIADGLRKPSIGWHTNLKEVGDVWMITLTINVNRSNLE